MRKLKTKLADDVVYTFSTLTLKEQNIARKLENLSPEEQVELDKLMEDTKGNALLDNDKNDKMIKLQDKQMKNLLKILVMSLAKAHKEEFTITEKNTEDMIIDKLRELIDLRDMRRFTSFALLGALPVEDDEASFTEETIDLTTGK